MKPFIAEYTDGTKCLVVGFVWGTDQLMAVVLQPDRSIDYEVATHLRMHQMSIEMPDIFEWPEPVPA